MCPPALRGSLEGKARFLHWGRRPVKFPSPLFKGLGEAHVPEGTQSGPLGLGEPRGQRPGRPSQRAKYFSEGSFFLCFFLFAIEKERRKPCALCRGRHPGRGAAGLLVTNGYRRLELKSPTGRCQGAARATHQKHPGGMFLRAVVPLVEKATRPCAGWAQGRVAKKRKKVKRRGSG